MALRSGTKLGPYEIIDAIGAGGMGEVYRARDTRLERTVAIKVLPEHLSDTSEARQRFEHEARAVSALNHPNICTLFDVGSQNGTEFLVMEYLEGETLAARLEKGPLPLNQTLKVAMEIADALDKAHRAGIIHRDLKPGNIILTKSGSKLLDFGLAKAAPSLASGGTLTAVTRTTPVAQPLTERGTIVGTFQYMSPEQVEARELDARSDLFSFGSVLYEMLTGRAAFQGRSQLSVASAILEKEPEPICTLQPMTPASLDRTVRKCLAKDPEDRWQTARDLLLELKWIGEAGPQAGAPVPVASHAKVRLRIAWAAAGIATLISIAATIGYLRQAPKATEPVHLNAELGTDASLATIGGFYAILSPDGTRLAFAALGADQISHLYIRSLDQLQATMLSDTEAAYNPFFSADGQWIAFFAKGMLKKISVQGGAAVTLCDAPRNYGGSWGEDDTIVFSKGTPYTLFKVSARGGASEPLTSLDEQRGELVQAFPQVLPGGKAVLFTSSTRAGNNFSRRMEDADIVAYSLSSRKYTVVQRGGFHARYLPNGQLVYVHNSTLFAVPFNLKRLEVTGQPVPVLERVAANPVTGGALFSISDTGTLIYVPGSEASIEETSIYWMDARGEFSPLRKTPGAYGNLAFAPDGKKLAMDITGVDRTDLWVYELERGTLTRVTSTGTSNAGPTWSPDGQRIAYAFSEKNERPNIWWARADGSGVAQRLTEGKLGQHPESWTPDGKVLAFFQVDPGAGADILTLPIEGSEESGWKPGQPKKFVADGFFNAGPVFSPDGHWIAYVSNQSGRAEVYVQPYPGPGARVQVSTEGGGVPEWSNQGKELFYGTTSGQIMVATCTVADGTFRAGKPRLWSPGHFTNTRNGIPLALHPDGKRFAVLKADKAEVAPAPINKITFIFNFFDELRGKAPAAKN